MDSPARVVTLCQELVRIESLSGREQGVADAVEREMAALGYDEVHRDELGTVVGLRHPARGATTNRLLFDAHMDVVPATEPTSWRFPPFDAVRAEGRIWGRGTTDIKGSLAAMIVALGEVPRTELAGTVVASASVGEERIEGLAVRHVVERFAPTAAVICEPTGLKLGLGHRGRASLVLEAAGRAAHTSRAENGVNAVYRLAEAIGRIRAMPARTDELLVRGHCELVEVSSLPFPGSSMVPYQATARFDRRLVRGETRESVLAEMRAAIEGLEGLTVRLHAGTLRCYTGASFEVEAFHPGWAAASDSDFACRAAQALSRVGLACDSYYAPYSTNGTATAGFAGLPTLVYGAGAIDVAHAIDESVVEDELSKAVRGYGALARSLAG